ncbi:hypothetical protein [Lonepinella koalarum]|uniref:hypothetical protein n=1 Tax=Lonepinella koalarum TaxID=53417 RepID=UPI003F6DDBFD
MSKFNLDIQINGQAVDRVTLLERELERAYVALEQFKSKLGHKGLKELFKDEIKQSDDLLWNASQNNDYVSAETFVNVTGMKTDEFLTTFHHFQETKMWAAHPEHYIVDGKRGCQDVMETVGHFGGPCLFRIYYVEKFTDFEPPFDPEFPKRLLGDIELISGGKIKMRAMHQFKDTEEGMLVKLNIVFPKNLPAEMIENHKWHLAIEFKNWLTLAYNAIHAK